MPIEVKYRGVEIRLVRLKFAGPQHSCTFTLNDRYKDKRRWSRETVALGVAIRLIDEMLNSAGIETLEEKINAL